MLFRITITILLVFSVLPLIAGEKPALHLTGNPQVDFFGNTSLLSKQLNVLQDTTISLSEDMSPGKEKSPWIAGIMSLVIPGSGEVYSQNYLKGAIFFAADIAAWSLAYSYNKRGDRQTDEFQIFADQHWSAVRYANWTMNHIGVLTSGQQTADNYDVFNDRYDPEDPLSCGPPFRCITWSELNRMEDSIGLYSPPGGNGYTHRLPHYAEQQYFELIGKYEEFASGWDDSNPNDNQVPVHSTSRRFFEYSNMRAQANHYYDIAGTWVSIAVLNHIVSAVDAYWSATKYNSALRADVKMRFLPTQYGLVPVTEARVRYIF